METPTFKAESLEDFDKKLLEQMRSLKTIPKETAKGIEEYLNEMR